MQRLRVRFCRGQEIKFISHLDIVRLWQRTFHRVGIPLVYSKGFNPHPQISLAAPLPVGLTSEAELMDVITSRMISPHWFTAVVSQQLPLGVQILQVYPMGLSQPSLQSLVRYAEYKVEVASEKDKDDVESALVSLLSLEHLPWQHKRDTGQRHYDLRALIDKLWLVDWSHHCCTLGMRLRCDNSGSGRAEQVVAALGFIQYPELIHRTMLILKTN
ncbi:TIGR03936 family radical SAM-associated protein [Chloroflexota bacterium]